MNHAAWLVVSVALTGCGAKSARPGGLAANGAATLPSTGPFPPDRLLVYQVTETREEDPDPDAPVAAGGFEVVCKQRTEVIDRWHVSTIECDPAAGMFNTRAHLEFTYLTDGEAWWSTKRRVTRDDAARWAGRRLTQPEIDRLLADAAGDLVGGPPPWNSATGEGDCIASAAATPNEGDGDVEDGHASSYSDEWCPLRGGGVRGGGASWSSESGGHSGSDAVELKSSEPLR